MAQKTPPWFASDNKVRQRKWKIKVECVLFAAQHKSPLGALRAQNTIFAWKKVPPLHLPVMTISCQCFSWLLPSRTSVLLQNYPLLGVQGLLTVMMTCQHTTTEAPSANHSDLPTCTLCDDFAHETEWSFFLSNLFIFLSPLGRHCNSWNIDGCKHIYRPKARQYMSHNFVQKSNILLLHTR